MATHLVFSLVGPDRTGIVERLSQEVVRQGGNLEDSRMAVLGGEFAVIMLVSIDDARRDTLQAGISAAAAELGMLVLSKETETRKAHGQGVPFRVTVRGMDHEGIVHEIVHHMAGQGVSIETLESHVSEGAFTGTAIFAMDMRITAPAAVSLVDIRTRLSEAGDRLNVDVEVEPLERVATAL